MFSHRTTTGMLLASLAARSLVAVAKRQAPTPDGGLNLKQRVMASDAPSIRVRLDNLLL